MPPFDYSNQSATLTRCLSLSVLKISACIVVISFIIESDQLQGMIQTAAQRVSPNRSLQLATRLPQTSSASVLTSLPFTS